MSAEVTAFMPDEKPSTTLPGTVEKIIPPWVPGEPEKAQISLQDADHLYREIRIDNNLTNSDGEPVSLKPGAEVDVTIQADPKDTVKKSDKTPENAA
jgi:hypothetical protein